MSLLKSSEAIATSYREQISARQCRDLMRDYCFQIRDAIARTRNTLEASDIAYSMVSTDRIQFQTPTWQSQHKVLTLQDPRDPKISQ